jgi:O-antigen ligase
VASSQIRGLGKQHMFKLFIVGLVLAGIVPQLGTPRLKYYLLACGVFTIPFSYDYTVYQLNVVRTMGFFQGWVDGILIHLSDVFFVLIPICCRRGTFPKSCRVGAFWMDRAIAIFLAMALVSSLFPYDRKIALVCCFELAQTMALYYWVTTRYFNWKEDGEFILKCLAAAVIFQSCLALWQAYFQTGFDFFRTGRPARLTGGVLQDDYSRPQGTVPQPNGFACYLDLAMLPLLAAFMAWKFQRKRLVSLSLVLGLIALMTTLSRGGWLGLACGAFYIACQYWGFKRSLQRALLAGLLAAVVVLAVPQIHQRLTGDDEGSTMDRWYLAQIAVGMIAAHPVTGVGINNYRLAMWNYVPKDYDWNFVYRVHTLPLLILAEMGVGGLLAFLYLFWRGISLNFGLARGAKTQSGLILAGVVAACLASFMHGIFDIIWTAPNVNAQFFFILGLGALARQEIEGDLQEAVLLQQEVKDESWEFEPTPAS